MPLVSVLCPSCAGKIQLDDAKESGFCLYCGSQVILTEALQKMTIKGEVSVSGITTLEKNLDNAHAFHMLCDFTKERALLVKLTNEYPGDYRAWWQLSKLDMTPEETDLLQDTPPWKQVEAIYYRLRQNEDIFNHAISARMMAPPEVRSEISEKTVLYFEGENSRFTRVYNQLLQGKKLGDLFKKKCEDEYNRQKEDKIQENTDKLREGNARISIRHMISLILFSIWVISVLLVLINVFAPEMHVVGVLINAVIIFVITGFLFVPLCMLIWGDEKKIDIDNYLRERPHFERNTSKDVTIFDEASKELSVNDSFVKYLAKIELDVIHKNVQEGIESINRYIQAMKD